MVVEVADIIKPLCIYHGYCDDGFAAAWVIHKLFPGVFEFYPGVHQQPPPNVTDRDVLLVDFSYKRPVLLEMLTTARSISIIDHHKTAEKDLQGPAGPIGPLGATGPTGVSNITGFSVSGYPSFLFAYKTINVLFDMNRSGAGLTWDFLSGKAVRPHFIDYIEDRDLWRKALPGADEFTIALRSYSQDFEVWDVLVEAGPEALITEGKSIQRYYRLRIEEFKRSAYESVILNHSCWIANAPYFAASEVAVELCHNTDAKFGACYFEDKGQWRYSLRSYGDFDVSEIAKYFGGGGHKNSAGFASDSLVHSSYKKG